MPGLTVRPAGDTFGPYSEFTVRGDVTARDGRLVIATRLYRHPDERAVWTATFWRSDEITSDQVDDIAGAVAEAVYGLLELGF
jgi:TolB-like protein